MKEYNFKVCFNDGRWCSGVISVKGKDEEEATQNALNYVCEKLYQALPELDIEVGVELANQGETE